MKPNERRGSAIRGSVVMDNTVIAYYPKEDATLAIIRVATAHNLLFQPLTDDQRRVVYGAMVDEEYDVGEVVINQGERGDLFYVVESGAFEARIKERGVAPVAHYEAGTGFGELALMYNSPRAASVTCSRAGRLWAIDRAVFNTIMIASNKAVFTSVKEFLSITPLLEALETKQIDALASIFEEVTYSVGELLWEADDAIETLFLVREGEVEVFAEPNEEEDYTLCPGAPGDPDPNTTRRGSAVLAPVDEQRRGSFSLIKQTQPKIITLRR